MMLRIKAGEADRAPNRRISTLHGVVPQKTPAAKNPLRELRDGDQQPLDVLRAGQPVVAVLDEGEHDVVLGEP